MSPKIVDKQQRRQEIALAALNVFSEKGFEAASISDVATAAGIGKGTVYEYFDSKDALITESMIAWIDSISDEAAIGISSIDDPEMRLRIFIEETMMLFLQKEDKTMRLFFFFMQLWFTHPEIFARFNLVEEAMRGMRTTINDILLEGVSKGIFKPSIAGDAERISINLAAYLDGIGLHYMMSPDYFDLMEQINFHLDNLLAAIRLPEFVKGDEDA